MHPRTLFAKPLAFLALSFIGCAAQTATSSTSGTTTIYVVRHAEKLSSDSDSPLSPAGEERAVALADRLTDAKVDRIYASTKLRTQQTVGVLAKQLGLEPVLLEPGAVDELVARINAEDRGKVVLVVGHNNTVPNIVKGLSGQEVEALPEACFDRLFRVTIAADGTATVNEEQYGAPTP